jgi:AdoMet-dependent heme synthase
MTRRTVIWEINRNAALPCVHCQTVTDPKYAHELSTYESYKTIDEIASINPESLIIAGGDPLARHDLFQIIDYAQRHGLAPVVELVASSNVTEEAIPHLKRSGAAALIFTINGASSYRHDALTTRGAYRVTLNALAWARAAALPVHAITVLNRRNMLHLSSIAELLIEEGVKSWTVEFEVPVGLERKGDVLAAQEAENVFATLAALQQNVPFHIRTMEAPEYRRYLLQSGDAGQWADFANFIPEEIASAALDDVVFIAHNGAVRPSAFLPMNGGNLRYRPLRALLQNSDLFAALSDRSNLSGKCGRCEFCHICGGSRARAWAMTGLLFGPDPLCLHQPAPEAIS